MYLNTVSTVHVYVHPLFPYLVHHQPRDDEIQLYGHLISFRKTLNIEVKLHRHPNYSSESTTCTDFSGIHTCRYIVHDYSQILSVCS